MFASGNKRVIRAIYLLSSSSFLLPTLLEFRLLNCSQNNWLSALGPMAHLIKTSYTRPEMPNPEAISRKNPGSYAIRTMLKRPKNYSRKSPSISHPPSSSSFYCVLYILFFRPRFRVCNAFCYVNPVSQVEEKPSRAAEHVEIYIAKYPVSICITGKHLLFAIRTL